MTAPGVPATDPRPAAGLAGMSPAYFGLVMATGIVSLSASMLGHPDIATALFYLNIGQYALLWVLYALRAWRHPRRFFGDMVSHALGPGYFTAVAGTGILASQFLILKGQLLVGTVLWGVELTLWFMLIYTIFTAFTVKRDKPSLARGINGGWLLAVVATQSVAVTSALLASYPVQPYVAALTLLALSMWIWGGMLYIWLISLIFYRYTFFRISVHEMTPPYWINMGAMAISTLAGSLLIRNAAEVALLQSLLPFLRGFTLIYWVTGTWWIPMLLLLGLWRYGYERFPIRYDVLYWGAVFPLGMYAASTWQMDQALGLDMLGGLSSLFFHAAIAAWGLTFLGMIYGLLGYLRRRQR